MDNSFEPLMAAKTDEELDKYINDTDRYTPEAINAAVAELQRRGRHFSEAELERIKSIVGQKIAAREKEFALESHEKKNIITNPAAPQYYSQRAITGFSIAFSVFAGAILFAQNVKNKPKEKWIVILYGVLYTTTAIIVLNRLNGGSGLTLFVNGIGAIPLRTFFWNKYIGAQTQYIARPIWKALIIAILITLPLLLLII